MTTDPLSKMRLRVHGKDMAYADIGSGAPIVFLHGNPTSSYLWRNVVPHVAGLGRAIVPDLIGMGDSDKLDAPGPGSYTFAEHRCYLDGLLEQVLDGAGPVTLVLHDWGSALGFDWANRHRDRVRGICYMEAIVTPLGWDDWPDDATPIFQGLRSEAGDALVLEKNIFVERILPASILRDLVPAEMDEYRRPFRIPGEDRRPTLTWPRQIPIGGDPAEVHDIVADYAGWMGENALPKLFINAEPGSILVGRQREVCRGWKTQTEVTVAGRHFIQEDSPHEIGQALADWLRGLS